LTDNELINVGEVSGVFGVKGWVKVFSFTQPRENILTYSPWILKKGKAIKSVKVLDGRRQGKLVVAALEGITDRDQAAELSGWKILINKEQLPATVSGEYYWVDLVGLRVVNHEGIELGTVDYLLETGANDVLVVKDNETERLIPFIQPQTISKVDLDDGLIVVDWDADF
jgi:16S rRNA processing protein RimM